MYIYVCIYTLMCTVPDMPNVHDILTSIGHPFGHHSGLGESSRRKSTFVLHEIAFPVYSIITKMTKPYGFRQQWTFQENACRIFEKCSDKKCISCVWGYQSM